MDIILDLFKNSFGIILTAFMGYVIWLLQEQKKEQKKLKEMQEEEKKQSEATNKALVDGVMLQLRYMLQRYHTEYMLQEFVTTEQYRNFEEIYNVYHSLKGNGTATKWFDEIKELEIRDDIKVGLSVYAQNYLKNKEGK